MAENTAYVKGTIKVKNVDEELIPFHPNTNASLVIDQETGVNLDRKLRTVSNQSLSAAKNGPVKERYATSDINSMMANYAPETMLVAWDMDEKNYEWNVVVDTTSSLVSGYTAVPFIMYGKSGTMTVDWGDGMTSTITSSNWSSAIHYYSTAGVYKVSIKHTNWSEVRMLTDYTSNYNSYSYKRYSGYTRYDILWYFYHSLKRILNPIPPVAGVEYLSSYSNSSPTSVSAEYATKCMFFYATQLESIPKDLFMNFPNATTFYSCFNKCSSLKEIPENLFASHVDANIFTNCFNYCSNLKEIPENLFAFNVNAIDFSTCFTYCSSLEEIPENLFAFNVNAIDFSGCFYYADSILDFSFRIGSPNVTDVSEMFNYCYFTTGTIYVPSNSTTYDTFINATNLVNTSWQTIRIVGE